MKNGLEQITGKNLTKEESLKVLKGIAKDRGGRCLSNSYINAKTKLEWKCNEGHNWSATPDGIKRGRWCPECGHKKVEEQNKKITIQNLLDIASKNEGKCLSKIYIDNTIKVEWECKYCHRWKASYRSIQQGSWCPVCAGTSKDNISTMHKLAAEKNGKCLSEKYTNSKSNLNWRCQKGHEWAATPSNIKKGRWCPKCQGKGYSKEEYLIQLNEIAKKHGGKCLSTRYVNAHTSLKWICKDGHKWSSTPSKVRIGRWCPNCAILVNADKQRASISEARQIAKDREGECLSKKYINMHSKLKWLCKLGHEWQAPLTSIKGSKNTKPTWCPDCTSFLGEKVCRFYMEQIFKHKFPKARPNWLKSINGKTLLELDGYSENLKIAFEHHGQYHYFVDGLYSKTKKSLERRQNVDQHKAEQCYSKGVKLIIIPEVFTLTPLSDVIGVIQVECNRLNIKFPVLSKELKPDIDMLLNNDQYFDELREVAKRKGGELLSNNYLGASSNLKWKCSKGHIWNAKPNNIKTGTWCPKCLGQGYTKEEYLKQLKAIAKERKGECLSMEYTNTLTKLNWRCRAGHEWKATPNNIRRGKWCPKCQGQGYTKEEYLQQVKNIAKERNGACLSLKYINTKTKLKWKCEKNHIWSATPEKIKSGTWCPICARSSKN